MVVDRRGRGGAAAISAAILLGTLGMGLDMAAVAHASPDSDSTAPAADRAPTPRAAQRSASHLDRQSGPHSRAGSGAARPKASPAAAQAASRSSRVPEPVPVTAVPQVVADEPSAPVVPPVVPPVIIANHFAPSALSQPKPAQANRPPTTAIHQPAQPPVLVGAGPARVIGTADSLTGSSVAPLQSALAWTMLAAARQEVGRRVNGPGASAAQSVGQTVSPLGTPEQTAAEAMAMRTAHSLPVLAMKAVLGLAWRITGAIEYSLVGGPDKENIAALRNAVDEWAMASAFQSMILNSNEPAIVAQVAPPHSWYGMDVTGSRILYDNPDTIYRFVGVNAASEYVLTGRLPENDPQASFSVLTGTTGTTVAVLDANQLELGPDRTFVITVSDSPTLPGEKNHLQITPDTTLIAIRDTLSDWEVQDPMSLAIHRTAGPPNSLFSQFGGFAIPFIGPLVAQSPLLTALVSLLPPLPAVPPVVRGSIAALLMLRGISEESKYIKVATTDPVTGKRKAPNVFTDPTSSASFLATQLQSSGYFQLADDEALVLTIKPNSAGYFVAPVTNDWTITNNYWDEQTSLNNAQARPNPDGSYTLVVSAVEPQLAGGSSVWNWVSTGGLNQGTMAIRFQSIDPADPNKPTVSSQVVSLSDLPSVLPPGTVVVTPVERAAQIAARGAGFNRRFAPYPQTA